MVGSFRAKIYRGFGAVLLVALFLMWLWRPGHQIRKHTDNLLHSVADKNWARFADFLSDDYHDQWNNDRAQALEKTREIFRYLRIVHITEITSAVHVRDRTGYWNGRILIDGDSNEIMAMLKERINTLSTPFELEWRRQSAKPWDWQLVAVRNEKLEIPNESF